MTHLLDLAPSAVFRAVKRQRAALKNPPQTAAQLPDTLENLQMVRTVLRLREAADLISPWAA